MAPVWLQLDLFDAGALQRERRKRRARLRSRAFRRGRGRSAPPYVDRETWIAGELEGVERLRRHALAVERQEEADRARVHDIAARLVAGEAGAWSPPASIDRPAAPECEPTHRARLELVDAAERELGRDRLLEEAREAGARLAAWQIRTGRAEPGDDLEARCAELEARLGEAAARARAGAVKEEEEPGRVGVAKPGASLEAGDAPGGELLGGEGAEVSDESAELLGGAGAGGGHAPQVPQPARNGSCEPGDIGRGAGGRGPGRLIDDARDTIRFPDGPPGRPREKKAGPPPAGAPPDVAGLAGEELLRSIDKQGAASEVARAAFAQVRATILRRKDRRRD